MQRLLPFVLLVLALLLPLAAQAAGLDYYVGVATRVLIFAVVASSLNFILGYGGMVSFGHAAFFGLGAYVAAIASFHGIHSAWLIWLLTALAGALAGLAVGAIALRTRTVHFIMITMALAQLLYYFFVGLRYYGGDDGLQIAARPQLGLGLDIGGDNGMYWLALAWLVATCLVLRRLLDSRFGLALNAIRENEGRAAAIGYPTSRYKLAAFVIAAVIAALAGSLLGMNNLFVSPKLLHWSHSGMLLVMVALGGVGYFYGGVVGAVVLLLLEEMLSSHVEFWQIHVGVILLVMVLVAPRGLASLASMGKLLRAEQKHGA